MIHNLIRNTDEDVDVAHERSRIALQENSDDDILVLDGLTKVYFSPFNVFYLVYSPVLMEFVFSQRFCGVCYVCCV